MYLFRKFIAYYRPYRGLFVLDMLCTLAVCAIDLAFPQVLKYCTDVLFLRPAAEIRSFLLLLAPALLAMYLLRFGCQYFITTWGHIMGAGMESDMRQALFNHYQRLSFSYYDHRHTGEMMSRIVSDLFDISELAHHGPETLTIAVLKILGAFALLLNMDWRLTGILLAVTAVMGIFSWRLNRQMNRVFTANRKRIANINSRAQDALTGIRVVQSFNNEKLEEEKFSRSNRSFLISKILDYRVMGKFHAGNGLFQGLLYLLILVYGGYLVSGGEMRAADLAIYALYAGIVIQPLEMLIRFTEPLQRGLAGFRRFQEVLDTLPAIADKPGALALTQPKGEIEFDRVGFAYETHSPVLHEVSFRIPAGKTVALVGPSGGGKTTICSLLPRFYEPTSGAIRLDGHDLRDLTLTSLRNAVGVVQQEVHLFSGTIRDNIAYGRPEAATEEIVEAARRANIHDFIVSLPRGYETDTGERGVRLSGGQKQRIAIARVFLKNPAVLVLDEATSALDNVSERQIQEALQELAKGRTSLVIAHRLSTIRHADEIIAVTDGRIAERGSHEELMQLNGVYAELYRLQQA